MGLSDDEDKKTEDKKTIVIIDDEPATVSVLEMYLRIRNFKPFGAHTGNGGLKAIAEHEPDAIILDLMLPDIDGLQICKKLRGEKKTEDLPIVMLSARTAPEDVKRGYAAGATRYLKKPVDLDHLANELSRVIENRKHKPPPPDVQDADARSLATG